MPEIVPPGAPGPVSVLGWDGANFYVLRVGLAGRLQVRGEDQLFSFKAVLAESLTWTISGNDGYLDSDVVTDGEIWVVTNIVVMDNTTATTHVIITIIHDGTECNVYAELRAFAAAERCVWTGLITLDPDDWVRARFIGGLAGDSITIDILGYRMTLET